MASRYNPLLWLILLFIYFYRYAISPYLAPRCRFSPTCSSYAISAFKTFGLIKGAWLTSKRLLKCHPFHKGGYDPIPYKPNPKRD